MSRLIALADYIDAMLTRKNDKFGHHPPTRAERREALMHDQEDLKTELEILLRDHVIDLREKSRD